MTAGQSSVAPRPVPTIRAAVPGRNTSGIGGTSAGPAARCSRFRTGASELDGQPGDPSWLRRSGQGHLGLASVACLRCHRPTGDLEHELPVRGGIVFVGTFDGVGELARVAVGVPARSALRCCRHVPTLPRPRSRAEDGISAQNEPSWRSSYVLGPCRWGAAARHASPSLSASSRRRSRSST